MSRQSLNYIELIIEPLSDLESLRLVKSQSVRSQERLDFLISLKRGACLTQVSAGALIGLKPRQSQTLWLLYKQKGLSAFLSNPYKGGNNERLDAQQSEVLLNRLDKDDMVTQGQVIAYVQQTFQVRYTPSGMSRKLGRLKVKAKTGRPVNIRKDVEGETEFKKNLRT